MAGTGFLPRRGICSPMIVRQILILVILSRLSLQDLVPLLLLSPSSLISVLHSLVRSLNSSAHKDPFREYGYRFTIFSPNSSPSPAFAGRTRKGTRTRERIFLFFSNFDPDSSRRFLSKQRTDSVLHSDSLSIAS